LVLYCRRSGPEAERFGIYLRLRSAQRLDIVDRRRLRPPSPTQLSVGSRSLYRRAVRKSGCIESLGGGTCDPPTKYCTVNTLPIHQGDHRTSALIFTEPPFAKAAGYGQIGCSGRECERLLGTVEATAPQRLVSSQYAAKTRAAFRDCRVDRPSLVHRTVDPVSSPRTSGCWR